MLGRRGQPLAEGADPKREASALRILLVNLWGYGSLVLWSLAGMAIFPFAFLLWKLVTRQANDVIMRKFVWIFGRIWIAIISPVLSAKGEVFNASEVPQPCIFVCNHFSALDAYFMALIPFADIAFVLRTWPFKIPLYTGFMKLAQYVDTEGLGWKGSEEMGKGLLKRGCSLLFFPEGHRSRTGKIGRFYSGAFRLAVDTQTPVVPLCLTGTRELLTPGKKLLGPARIRLRVLPAISPAGVSGPLAHLRLREQVKATMVDHLRKLAQEEETGLAAAPSPVMNP